jgi:hypothetical protein
MGIHKLARVLRDKYMILLKITTVAGGFWRDGD